MTNSINLEEIALIYDGEYLASVPNTYKAFLELLRDKAGITNEEFKNKTVYRIEDESRAPTREYYFPIGFIPKPDRDSNTLEEIVEKDPGKIINITKHYRRYFKTGLESVKELKIKSPFYTAYLRRGKDKDIKDETAIFTALTEINNKIIKAYDPADDDKTFQEKQEIKKQRTKNKEYI